jgi:hypothetical protein
MKLTITIEDEQGAETLVERPAARLEPSTETPTEVETTNAGGPPAELLEQLQGGASPPHAGRSPDALDAGAAKASGNGSVATPA